MTPDLAWVPAPLRKKPVASRVFCKITAENFVGVVVFGVVNVPVIIPVAEFRVVVSLTVPGDAVSTFLLESDTEPLRAD